MAVDRVFLECTLELDEVFWLVDVLSESLLLNEIAITFTTSVIQISVIVQHLRPRKVYHVAMAEHLLTHVYKDVSCHRVIEHDLATSFFKDLISEECGLLSHVVNSSCFERKHEWEQSLWVVRDKQS